jgi:peptide/nickel transport system substrate-binding protein
MEGKRVYLAFCCALFLTLLLASCGQSASTTAPIATTTPAVAKTTQATTAPQATTTAARVSEKPKYGGTVTFSTISDPMGFDQTFTIHFQAPTLNLTNESLLTGDWAKGPAGTGQTDWSIFGNIIDYDNKTGCIAESYQIPEPGHMIFKIRRGIRFGLNQNAEASRLVNGRELTADDVVWSWKRYTTETTSYVKQSAPDMCKVVQITAPDKYTVDVLVPREQFIWVLSYLPDWSQVIPLEVTTKYGDMRDWKNSVGTGPYFLIDFVSASSVSFARNPAYWDTDPVGPGKGSKLPYLDGVKVLIISDTSTLLSALRTGKLDTVGALGYDDANEMKRTVPQLVNRSYAPESGNMIYMRTDKQDLPFKDKRVRQAMMLATDFDTISKNLYGGTGIKNTYPMTPVQGYIGAYLPVDEAPAAVQDLYKYNPDKAKQLLKDAGYPNGFKTTIVSTNTAATVDYLSVVKEMWSKVGIDLTLDPKETGVLNTIYRNRAHEQLIYAVDGSVGTFPRMLNYDGPSQQNSSYVDDQSVRDVRTKIYEALYAGKNADMNALHKNLMKYVLEQAWVVPSVLAKPTTFWWPWLKGYSGEQSPGNNNMWMWAKYVWVDQDLKFQTVGRR